ncbi:M23 family metallopeptidase [Breznakiella homolactica]|uniref:M23 family metallopeptidase n=1 Tax=Breznakiella homolactica TaxID=2798577 RepID=UPI001CBA61FC|nr:M23 family metallopeptidase [Breznakiella homolactica]
MHKRKSYTPRTENTGYLHFNINQFKQHPAQGKKHRKDTSQGFPVQPGVLSNLFKVNYSGRNPLKNTTVRRKKNTPSSGTRRSALFPGTAGIGINRPAKRKSSGAKAPAPGSVFSTLGTICGVAIIGIVSFLAINWEGFAPYRSVSVIPEDDGGHRLALAAYTGLNTPEQGEAQDDAIPLDLMETFSWESYTVQRGDSVSKIAASRSLSMDAVIASNGITNAKRIQEGQVLRLPNMDGVPYTVKSGDSLSKIASGLGVPLEAVLDANDLDSEIITPGTVLFIPGAKMRTEDLKMALGELFIYPIRGRLTSPYGWRSDPFTGVRRFHAAIDLAAPTGTTIKASMDGRISAVGYNSVYGKYVIVTHSNGYQTLYAHMNATSAVKGDYVTQGSKIGEVGSTGLSTGPHVHFAIYKNGRAVNPLEFLNS